ncbi:hypothetical protein OYC64_016059 [Pagothenia borchgrevinki]|uniref:Uncharacterized protein n=1 Tax=Pagothenia borchgrevinki TaxID=8213 RepID=A0ABD2HIB2_PAGBO
MACLDPSVMYRDPDRCKRQIKCLVQRFLQDKQLTGGVPAGDVILQQFEAFLSLESRSEEFLSFQPMQKRLEIFLRDFLGKTYPELWAFCQKLLILSHGQASVERGFSVNKEVETCNMQQDTFVAQRLVCDYVTLHGGVTKVPLTRQLLNSVSSARSRYHIHLDQERRKKESEAQGRKRKAEEDHLEELKRRKKSILEVSEGLARDADRFVAQRLVCDYVTLHGGVTKVPLTRQLLNSVSSARSRYHIHLDRERRKKESEAQGRKRKAEEDHLEELKRRKKSILEVSEGLARDADRFAEEAEGKAGSKMAMLISKSNLLRRGFKEKLA